MFLKARAQQKYLINYVLQGPFPTHELIYINTCIWLTPNISNKSSFSCAMVSYAQYKKFNIKITSHKMGLVPISVRSKIQDITSLLA